MASAAARTSSEKRRATNKSGARFREEIETVASKYAYISAMTPAQRPFAPIGGYARQVLRLERGVGIVLWVLLAAVVFVLI